jgi:alpha-L-fucosidase
LRWIGNEAGQAGDPNWSTVVPSVVPVPGTSGRAATQMMQHGDPAGAVWRPGETDVSIRPGWFHHPEENARVRSEDNLVNLYFTSVGRNSKLLLNVPPTRDGLLDEVDTARLTGMHDRLTTMFADDLAKGRKANWRSTGDRTATVEVDLGRTVSSGLADLGEDIAHGQLVARYTIEGSDGGDWRPLSKGTTIGYRKLDRFPAVSVRRVRLTIEDAVAAPRPVRLGIFAS